LTSDLTFGKDAAHDLYQALAGDVMSKVDAAGEQLLPGSALASDQHAEIRLRGAIGLRERLEERGRAAEDRRLARLRRGTRERSQRKRVPNLDDHLGQTERLGHEAEGARPRRADGCVDPLNT